MTNDFIAYWSAVRLLLTDGNAYSPVDVLAVNRTVGWSDSMPCFMYNPPWTLPLILPFGWFDYDTAQFLWFILHTVIIFLGFLILSRHYARTPAPTRVEWLALFTFAPIYFVLLIGQIGPLVLAGIIGFLLAERKRAWFWAGTSLAVASIKPHLLYLLWIAVVLWVLRERQWRLGAGFVAIFSIMIVVPLLFNLQIYANYISLMANDTVILPMDWANPNIGVALSAIFGNDLRWLRWIPAIGGITWLLCYWHKNAKRWDWSEDLPLILLVSIVTTPYCWTFDYVILLPAVIHGAVRFGTITNRKLTMWLSISYLALFPLLLIGKILVRNDFWYFWLAPVLLLIYLWVRWERGAIGAQHKTIS